MERPAAREVEILPQRASASGTADSPSSRSGQSLGIRRAIRRGRLLAAFAALCSSFACEGEVTVHLLATDAGSGGGPDSSGGKGGSPATPCQKVGSEVCNGGDDDCNGLVDEGCDYGIIWKEAPEGAPLGHAPGGVMFFQPCPAGAVLVGFGEGMGTWLNQVSAICRQVEVHADATQSPVTFTAMLGQRVDTPFVPFMTSDPNQVGELVCPEGSIVSGVDGTTSDDASRYILGIRITCAPPIVTTLVDVRVFEADPAQEETVGPVVCAGCQATQAYNFTTRIPTGQIATGLYGGAGQRIDRVGVSVSVASVTRRLTP